MQNFLPKTTAILKVILLQNTWLQCESPIKLLHFYRIISKFNLKFSRKLPANISWNLKNYHLNDSKFLITFRKKTRKFFLIKWRLSNWSNSSTNRLVTKLVISLTIPCILWEGMEQYCIRSKNSAQCEKIMPNLQHNVDSMLVKFSVFFTWKKSILFWETRKVKRKVHFTDKRHTKNSSNAYDFNRKKNPKFRVIEQRIKKTILY